MNVIEERERETTKDDEKWLSIDKLRITLEKTLELSSIIGRPLSRVPDTLQHRKNVPAGPCTVRLARVGASSSTLQRMNAFSIHPRVHTYTYKRESSRLRHSRVPRVSLKVSLFSYVTKVRGISTSFFRNPIFSTDDLPIADSFHCFRSRRNKFLIFHPLSFVSSNYTSVYVAFTLSTVLTFFNFQLFLTGSWRRTRRGRFFRR